LGDGFAIIDPRTTFDARAAIDLFEYQLRQWPGIGLLKDNIVFLFIFTSLSLSHSFSPLSRDF